MKNIDSQGHVSGKSVYVDDIPELQGTLHGVAVFSSVAHAEILRMDFSKAEKAPGVVAVLTARDIKGKNQIGGIIADEPLFAETEVHYIGQPIAVIIAETHFAAKLARKKVAISYGQKEVIIDPRIAKEKGDLLFPPRTFVAGDTAISFANCDYVFTGRADSGAQEHLYIETQGSYAIPLENNNIKIYSSTQGPTVIQNLVARVLGISMHHIEVDVTRLGGAFGGKEDQATAWAAMAALAAQKLNKPVKIILDREDDMVATGKRHPYSSDFKIGINKDLKISAFEVSYYQNGGAAADLSPAILERTLFHVTNSYFIPNIKATAYSCKTNLAPFTAFRGFGGPQAMFVIESAIALAAEKLGIDKAEIQLKNLLKKDDEFHYGQICDSDNASLSWEALNRDFNLKELRQNIEGFNTDSTFVKKGLALMPICFGISFTKTALNQARALVHIYQDGSIGISTGAVEMGQGVNTKMMQIAAGVFSVDISQVKIESTNTTRVANTSPTAASTGADLNGKALLNACSQILIRLNNKAAEILQVDVLRIELKDNKVLIDNKPSALSWEMLIETAYLDRVKLSEVGHYATPIINFDKSKEKGHPFAYHVFGTAAITVKVDCVTGVYETEEVKIVHDFGNSMNLGLDMGQVEGAVVQGIGWLTIEELDWDKEGRLLAGNLSKYKVPDIYSAPKSIETIPLKTNGPDLALLKSKAVGEPPFMYGIAAYFALRNAIKEFNKDCIMNFEAPLTPEKVLMALYSRK
ncbi:MAG: molybdopterin-dependent oxidoreductase [Bacteroidales bacterium]|nr:molybdopterin-dependent oxidoreductase [Bacteroidales bacterium]